MNWKEFRERDKVGLLVKRREGSFGFTKSGYRLNVWVFRAYIVLSLAFFFFVAFSTGAPWLSFYYHCPYPEDPSDFRGCENPFYLNCDRAECQGVIFEKVLPAGFTIGEKNEEFDKLSVYFIDFVILGAVMAFVVNHLLFNWRRDL